MGLTRHSVGRHARERDALPPQECTRVIALAGNPNVGKSTLFNTLTGMRQHTGNWPGKTVTTARGQYRRGDGPPITLVDLPGTYSLLAHSPEEEVARDFICFSEPDAVIVVCDATAPERSINLVLQVMEAHPRVAVCVNLMDEARRKGIRTDLAALERRLGVPVVGTVARRRSDADALMAAVTALIQDGKPTHTRARITYPDFLERALAFPQRVLEMRNTGELDARFVAVRLLDPDPTMASALEEALGEALLRDPALLAALNEAHALLHAYGVDADGLHDTVGAAASESAATLTHGTVTRKRAPYSGADRRIDRILTGKWTAYPVMLLLLALIFYLTVSFSNIPSGWLMRASEVLLAWLTEVFTSSLGAPPWLTGLLCDGMLRVLLWVVSVMLPPMAIFFPLFTLLEDAGVLPRIAYDLDRPFACCRACGKQSLTMCMGLGCNAAGVVGCRIIDSPRERLLAILTNSLMPCNGRFPALIAVLTMFCIGAGGAAASVWSALLLCALVLLSVLATFFATRLLSCTVLRGSPSSFVLELPPYRVPQVGKVLVRSLFDRTLFVLGRAVTVAAPAGLLIWCMANITVGNVTLLAHLTAFLDPFAQLLGMDGVILAAFILGFPANEIVLPLIVMAYSAGGTITELASLAETRALLVQNGWTWATAVCVLLFFLFHWPCSTTLLTVKKETGSRKYTLLAALLPTLLGVLACMLFTAVAKIFF